MKLSLKAINAFKGNNKLRNRLALELGCSVYTVDRWLKDNHDNGDLTKAKSLQVIREETNLVDSEILEENIAEPLR
jgi:hypothetical protein